jgi:hypothetical protein
MGGLTSWQMALTGIGIVRFAIIDFLLPKKD